MYAQFRRFRLTEIGRAAGADPGFFKRASSSTRKEEGPSSTRKKGGPGGGPILGPMLRRLHSGPKRGGRTPPPWVRP